MRNDMMLTEQEMALVDRQLVIQAIKAHRDRTGSGLVDAKAEVDRYRANPVGYREMLNAVHQDIGLPQYMRLVDLPILNCMTCGGEGSCRMYLDTKNSTLAFICDNCEDVCTVKLSYPTKLHGG